MFIPRIEQYTPDLVPEFEESYMYDLRGKLANTHDPKDAGLSAQAMKFPGSKNSRPPFRLKRQKSRIYKARLERDPIHSNKLHPLCCRRPQRVGPTRQHNQTFKRPTMEDEECWREACHLDWRTTGHRSTASAAVARARQGKVGGLLKKSASYTSTDQTRPFANTMGTCTV